MEREILDSGAAPANQPKAGVDDVVWVACYDMSFAQIDPQRLLLDYGMPPRLVPNLRKLPFFETPGASAAVHTHLTNLESWICQGVAEGKAQADARAKAMNRKEPIGSATCLGWRTPGFTGPGDMQETAVGGSPHPSEEGHQKIANAVNAVLKK